MKYFVMLRLQKGFPTPLVDEEGDVVLFPSRNKARLAACDNMFGEVFGFEIYPWD